MTDALIRVKKIFDMIEKAESIDSLKEIQNTEFTEGQRKKYFPGDKYPQLKLSLSNKEIEQLKADGFLDGNGSLSKKCADEKSLIKNMTPLEKLLYSVLWKNGDLGKEKHITDGVLRNRDSGYVKGETGLVFYYFGLHLDDKKNPIIDQHVIRAFKLFRSKNPSITEIDMIIKKDTVTDKDKAVCEDYISWQNKLALKAYDPFEFTYNLDRLLFGLGKSLKKQQTKYGLLEKNVIKPL